MVFASAVKRIFAYFLDYLMLSLLMSLPYIVRVIRFYQDFFRTLMDVPTKTLLSDEPALPMQTMVNFAMAYPEQSSMFVSWLTVAYFVYSGLCKGIWGRTAGMGICGLRLLSRDGGRPGFGKAFLHSFLVVLFAQLLTIPMWFRLKRYYGQRWQDYLSKTFVVDTRYAVQAPQWMQTGRLP